MSFAERLSEVRGRIGEAAVRSGRTPSAVTLLAVTKTFSPPVIQEAYDLGLRLFGENRVQEALEKIVNLPADIHWHLIGQIQTNKINKIVGKFDLLQSVHAFDLAQAISKRLNSTKQDILLEVNTSGESSKSGADPISALTVARQISGLPGLCLRGVMTVGPLTDNTDLQRSSFKTLKTLFDRMSPDFGNDFNVLSMGMSGDYEIAIEEGSTLVRVGSALFGERR